MGAERSARAREQRRPGSLARRDRLSPSRDVLHRPTSSTSKRRPVEQPGRGHFADGRQGECSATLSAYRRDLQGCFRLSWLHSGRQSTGSCRIRPMPCILMFRRKLGIARATIGRHRDTITATPPPPLDPARSTSPQGGPHQAGDLVMIEAIAGGLHLVRGADPLVSARLPSVSRTRKCASSVFHADTRSSRLVARRKLR